MTFENRGKIYNNITETIGATPLVRLNRLPEQYDVSAEILLKLEFFNPMASVKDRIGVAMIEDLENRGLLNEISVIVEPTSGNTGIALAFACAAKGYRLILCMPESMSIERRKMLLLLGAELELTPAELGMKGAIAKAEELITNLDNAVMPQQFDNPANPEIHRNTTAQEILADTDGQLDAVISGVGTAGTLTGIGNILKQHNPSIKIYAVEPEDSPVLSGGDPGPHKIQGIGAGFIPKNLDLSIVDKVEQVTNDESIEMALRLAKEEGLLVGISCGAAAAAAVKLAEQEEYAGKTIVVVLPDLAERYLSSVMFTEVPTGIIQEPIKA